MDPKVAVRVQLVDDGQNLRNGHSSRSPRVGQSVRPCPVEPNEIRRRFPGGGSRCVVGWVGPDQATWILLVTVFPVRMESTFQMEGRSNVGGSDADRPHLSGPNSHGA